LGGNGVLVPHQGEGYDYSERNIVNAEGNVSLLFVGGNYFEHLELRAEQDNNISRKRRSADSVGDEAQTLKGPRVYGEDISDERNKELEEEAISTLSRGL